MKKLLFMCGGVLLLSGCVATVTPEGGHLQTSYVFPIVETHHPRPIPHYARAPKPRPTPHYARAPRPQAPQIAPHGHRPGGSRPRRYF